MKRVVGMRTGRRLLRVAAGLASAGLIVSACTSGPPPARPITSVTAGTSAPTTTAPAATTTTSAPTTTTLSDTDAAMAAAQRYIAAFNDAVTTGSTTEFRKTFITGCNVCTADADNVDQIAKAGRKVEGGVVSFVTCGCNRSSPRTSCSWARSGSPRASSATPPARSSSVMTISSIRDNFSFASTMTRGLLKG